MKNDYPSLNVHFLKESILCCQPSPLPEVVGLDSPALESFTDFQTVHPIRTYGNTTIDDAIKIMKLMQVRFLLIIDDKQKLTGVINSRDIQGRKPVEYAQAHGLTHKEITVAMIMTPTEKIHVAAMGSLTNARVGHVLNTLKSLNQPYLLVVDVDPDTHAETLRGLFAISQISQQLDEDINVLLGEAQSLLDLTSKRRQ